MLLKNSYATITMAAALLVVLSISNASLVFAIPAPTTAIGSTSVTTGTVNTSNFNLTGTFTDGVASLTAGVLTGIGDITSTGVITATSFVGDGSALTGIFSPALTDNISNALNVHQGADNYLNINTTDSAENISFGNTATNPTFNFLGTGQENFGNATFTTVSGNGSGLTTLDPNNLSNGSTLNAGVLNSSLTSVGTLSSLIVSGLTSLSRLNFAPSGELLSVSETLGSLPPFPVFAPLAAVTLGSTATSGQVTSMAGSPYDAIHISVTPAFTNPPFCTISPANLNAAIIQAGSFGAYVTATTNTINIYTGSDANADLWNYHCFSY